jgi:hypothetical protein
MSNGAKAGRDTLARPNGGNGGSYWLVPKRDRPYTLKSFRVDQRTRSMQPAVRYPALPQFGSQSKLERFIKQILQRLPCLARNFARQQRCVLIDMDREVGYIGFIRFAKFSGPLVH